jgi:polysaccharide biosynthesis transport protein
MSGSTSRLWDDVEVEEGGSTPRRRANRKDRWWSRYCFRLNGVRNPVSLAARLQLPVHTLPRLPTRRMPRTKFDASIERYTDKLDHVRFAFRKSPCLLVTSAVRGEGKTMLAAQLAARCGGDGITTLLIDADYRNRTLCSMLDVPDGPGLHDWLKGDAEFDDTITTVNYGLFSLMRAARTEKCDFGLLPDAKIKTLIEQVRKSYDYIIIDTPPLRDCTFALTLSMHVDLAILSVMHNESRYPLVAQAKRRLAGAPAIGVVLNGCERESAP